MQTTLGKCAIALHTNEHCLHDLVPKQILKQGIVKERGGQERCEFCSGIMKPVASSGLGHNKANTSMLVYMC